MSHVNFRDSMVAGAFYRGCRIAAIVGLLLVSGCHADNRNAAASESAARGETLRRGLGGEPASLDPAEATDTFSFEVLRDVYEGLTTESAGGSVMPGVALSWTVNSSGTEYKFKLRPNARWSNGVRVRAMDFVTAWRRVVDPKLASPVADTLRPIIGAPEIISGRLPPSSLGVFAENDDLLVIRLSKPAPYFLQLLTHTAMFPVYTDGSARSHDPKRWVSNGPFVLSEWTPGEKLELTKNHYYWDQKRVHLNKVDYIFDPDESAELRQYLAGELDITESVPTSALESIRRSYPAELHVWPFLGVSYYALNLQDPQFRNNARLRESLAMAIDRKILVSRILDFGQHPAYGFVPLGTWNYTPQSWDWKNMISSDRLAKARKLYNEAGYSTRRPLHIKLLINSNPTIRQTTIAIAAMWRSALGIKTEIVEQEYRVFLQSRRDKSLWDIARLGWTADYNDAGDFLDIFRSDSPNNDSGYANPKFDDLLDRAAQEADPLRRRQLLEEAESLMLSDYPVIPIYFYVSKRLIKPYIRGAKPNPLNHLDSKYLVIAPH